MMSPVPMTPADHKHGISDEVKINILMKEYETLRSEILHRLNRRFALLGLFGAVLAYALFKVDKYTTVNLSVIFASIFILGAIWFRFGQMIQRCSSRILEIEQQVNSLVGDELLVWETRRRSSFFHRLHR